MGTTSTYGWRIPDLNSGQPNGPQNFADLTTDVEATLQAAKLGGGSTQTSGISMAAGSGWGSLTQQWIVRNGFMHLRITATRTGSTITSPSNGNIGTNVVATLSDHTPIITQVGLFTANSTHGAAGLNTGGTFQLFSMVPTATIATSDVVVAVFTYPI